MRNPRRELNDIRFEFQPSTDTAQGIAGELLATGLITKEDMPTISTNLNQLVTSPPPSRVLTFRVTTGYNTQESPDEKNLSGFAQLSLC